MACSWLSKDDASKALRISDGDVERAKIVVAKALLARATASTGMTITNNAFVGYPDAGYSNAGASNHIIPFAAPSNHTVTNTAHTYAAAASLTARGNAYLDDKDDDHKPAYAAAASSVAYGQAYLDDDGDETHTMPWDVHGWIPREASGMQKTPNKVSVLCTSHVMARVDSIIISV